MLGAARRRASRPCGDERDRRLQPARATCGLRRAAARNAGTNAARTAGSASVPVCHVLLRAEKITEYKYCCKCEGDLHSLSHSAARSAAAALRARAAACGSCNPGCQGCCENGCWLEGLRRGMCMVHESQQARATIRARRKCRSASAPSSGCARIAAIAASAARPARPRPRRRRPASPARPLRPPLCRRRPPPPKTADLLRCPQSPAGPTLNNRHSLPGWSFVPRQPPNGIRRLPGLPGLTSFAATDAARARFSSSYIGRHAHACVGMRPGARNMPTQAWAWHRCFSRPPP